MYHLWYILSFAQPTWASHPTFGYVATEVNGEVYIVALELLKATAEKAGWLDPKFMMAR